MTLSEQVSARTQRECGDRVLRTERLLLRALQPSDARAIARLAGDLRVSQNTGAIPHPYRSADAKQFLDRLNNCDGEATFAVTRDDVLIGICSVNFRKDGPELGYWLGVPYWGKGYGTEAARAVVDKAFTELGHSTLYSGARISNPASRRVLEKCGFQWTGVRLLRIPAINSSAPSDRFRLDRKLWESLRSWGQVRLVP